jgi:hypothetical protein
MPAPRVRRPGPNPCAASARAARATSSMGTKSLMSWQCRSAGSLYAVSASAAPLRTIVGTPTSAMAASALPQIRRYVWLRRRSLR